MDKNYILMFVIAALVGITILGITNANLTGYAGKTPVAQCKDHIDNDGDGYCDFARKGAYCKDGSIIGDKDCVNADDNREASDCVPANEVCDNKDNDCDSLIDEGLDRSCGISEVGECSFGLQTCSSGVWGSCIGNVDPKPEVCEGILDESCNGVVDENCSCINGRTKQCGISEVGECSFGLQTCSSGVWGSCIGNVDPANEVCDNKDNDCDGETDEGCQCVDGQTKSCGSDIGECVSGIQTCLAGIWGACANEVLASTEICDVKDNDCDTLVDESLPILCSSSSQCGNAGWSSGTFCGGDGNVYKNWVNYQCNNAGTCNSYCSVTNTTYFYQNCNGVGCLNGGCLFVNTCTDSDNGYNFMSVGNITGIRNGYSYSYTDACLTNTTLTEYYCSGTSPVNTTINCVAQNLTACSWGRCY